MFDVSIDTLFNPVLLFWISFFYLVILFHSFGIERIWNRINGIELLFLSAVIGYIYYNLSNYLIFPLIELIKGLIELFPTMVPSFLSILQLQINYTDFGKFFVYLFITILIPTISYFVIIFPIYLIVKILQYCLDPRNEIFSQYQRFISLKKNNIPEIFIYNLPFFFFTIGAICLFIGGFTNALQNIIIPTEIWTLINTFLQIIFLISCLIGIYIELLILKEQGKKISPLLFNGLNFFLNYLDRTAEKDVKTWKTSESNILSDFVKKYPRPIFLFIIFCLFLLYLNQFKEGVIPFYSLLFWSLFFIICIIIAFIPQKWRETIKFKLIRVSSTKIASNLFEKEKPEEKKSDFFSIDAPLEDPVDDQFNRTDFTSKISQIVASRKDPSSFVIGIYGEWGEGKTTVLNFIKRELEITPEIICVSYNPWRYNDETLLLQNFFYTLSDALERSLSNNKEIIGEWLSKYATILAPLSICVGGIVQVSPSEIFSNAGKVFSSVELDELKKRIEKILEDEQKRVVIFIDDIDRMDRQEIQTILKLVKLSADFKYTTYILALDEELVASALGEIYGENNVESGKKFLEKIIQVPLNIPKINIVVLRNMCFKGIDDLLNKENIHLTDEASQQFAYQFNQGFITRISTPRIIKRYFNALSFSLPLLKNKINLTDLLFIEAIRNFYPSIFLDIRKNPDAYIGSGLATFGNTEGLKKRYAKIVNEDLEKFEEFEKENVKNLLSTIFPRIQTLFGNIHYGPDWDKIWDDKQQLASKRFLDRYFAYTFPDGDVSEVEVKNFVENIENYSNDQLSVKLKEILIDDHSAELFLVELRKILRTIPIDKRRYLAIFLSKKGIHFSSRNRVFGLSPFSQLATFLHEILLTIDIDNERFDLAKDICINSQPITLGFEFIHWIQAFLRKDLDKKIFADSNIDQLVKILIERLNEISKESVIFLDYPEFTPQIFHYWSTYSKDETEAYLSKIFEKDADNAILFLKCYLSKAWSITGLPIRGSIPWESYNSIIKCCDASIIYNILEKKYGAELKNAEYKDDKDIELNKYIAYQFAYLYHHPNEHEQKHS